MALPGEGHFTVYLIQIRQSSRDRQMLKLSKETHKSDKIEMGAWVGGPDMIQCYDEIILSVVLLILFA